MKRSVIKLSSTASLESVINKVNEHSQLIADNTDDIVDLKNGHNSHELDQTKYLHGMEERIIKELSSNLNEVKADIKDNANTHYEALSGKIAHIETRQDTLEKTAKENHENINKRLTAIEQKEANDLLDNHKRNKRLFMDNVVNWASKNFIGIIMSLLLLVWIAATKGII